MNFPKVLVLANNAFSQTNSNGRTLGNFFMNWPKDKLAQFALLAEGVDASLCTNYFIVTDRQALQAFKTGKPAKNSYPSVTSTGTIPSPKIGKKIKRSPFTMLLRNLVWESNRWRGKEFNEWVNAFQPDLILLQAGDAPFMYDLAVSLAKERRVPLVIYNSECYYFKDFCYFTNTHSAWLYPLFRYVFKRSFERAMRYLSAAIYATPDLEQIYAQHFKHRAISLLTATTIHPVSSAKPIHSTPQIVYLGNLGLNRHKALIQIAQEVQKINPSWKVAIYGKIPPLAEKELRTCSAIELKGFVSYEDVIRVQTGADLLLHAEYDDPFYTKDLRYAFSTKIADCLASGVPLLAYAPATLSCMRYLKQHQAAFLAHSTQELAEQLRAALLNPAQREKVLAQAKNLADTYHNMEKNVSCFKNFLWEIYENTPRK